MTLFGWISGLESPETPPVNVREGGTWVIAIRRGSYKSLFLPNSGLFPLERKAHSVLNSGSLKTMAQVLPPRMNGHSLSDLGSYTLRDTPEPCLAVGFKGRKGSEKGS